MAWKTWNTLPVSSGLAQSGSPMLHGTLSRRAFSSKRREWSLWVITRTNVQVQGTVSILITVQTDPLRHHLKPGSIQCRFTPSTNNIQYLGEFLRDRQNHSHSLYFVIRERYRETDARQVMITQKVIEEMMSSGRFSMGQIKFPISSPISSTEILLSFGNDEYFLSGFPRMLPQEDPPRSKSTPCLHSHFHPIGELQNSLAPRRTFTHPPQNQRLIFWLSSHPPPGRQLLPHPHPLAAATPGPMARARARRHPQRRPRPRRRRHHLALFQSRICGWRLHACRPRRHFGAVSAGDAGA